MISELRFSGLASGIDTESIVKKLMEAERIPLDKMQQQKQRLEWQRDAYREMNSLLLELRNLAFEMKLQGTYLTKTATSTSTAFKATAGANAPVGVHQVEVLQLAKGITAASTTALPEETKPDGSIMTLKEQFGGIADTVVFELNGEKIEINTAAETIFSLVNKINSYKRADGSDLGVTASYDATLNRFFLNTKGSGTDAKIEIRELDPTDPANPAANAAEKLFSNFLQFNFDADGDTDSSTLSLTGQDAKIIYDGVELTSSTNQITVNGITFELKGTTSDEQPATLIISNNTDGVFDKIVAFVNKYNEIIEKINGKLSEPRYRDYPPLTDAQKEEMTEKQIELWEEKAKSGILQGDAILSSALSQFRRDFAQAVDGLSSDMDSMFDLGFTTGSYEQRGKIVIDENKLRQALAEKPEKVMALFTKSVDTDNIDPNSTDIYSQQGIAQRLYNSIDKAIKQITEKAGSAGSFSKVDDSYLGKALDDLEERMDAFEKHLKDVEDRYWRQFTAMEQAIQRANMQSAWLMQTFGGGMQQG